MQYRRNATHLRYLAATLNQSSILAGVTSFNTRTGDVTLLSADVVSALGYTPVTQARTLTINGVTQDLSANRSWTISTATPTLAQVTTAGNTTTNSITVGSFNLGSSVAVSTFSGFGLNYFNVVALTAGQGISAGFGPSGTPTGYAYNFQFGKSSTVNNNSLLFIGGGASAGPAANKHLITTSTDGTATAQPLSFAVATGSWASATALMTLTPTQNVLIGTTTDAGYKLDVAGSVRFTQGLTVDYLGVKIGGVTLLLDAQGGGTISSANSVGNPTTYITMRGPVHYNPTSGVAGTFAVTGQSLMSSGTATFNTLTVSPTINNSGTYSGIFRGLYYNPTLTSLTGTTHRAIETTSGDVIINTQSASVNSGYTTMAIGGSSGVYFQMYVGPSPTSQSLRGQIWAVGNNLLFNNPGAGYLGLYTTLYSGITVWPTTGNVYVGASPSTDAGYKLDVAGSARIQGVITGSVPAGGSLVLGASASNQRAIYVNGYFVSTGAIVTNNYNSRSYNTTIGGQENGLILEYNGNNQAVSNTNRYFVVAGSINITGGTVDLQGYTFIPTIVSETNATIKAFTSTLSAASNRYNLYLSGDAQNYIAGNLGIGTTTPTEKLEVSGNVKISGNLTTSPTYTNCGLLSPIGVAENTTETIGFAAKIDPNGWWNPGTKRWTPTVPGFYFVTLQVRWDIGTLGNQINIQILKNLATVGIAQDLLPTNTGLTHTTSAIIEMNGSTDYITFTGYTSSTTGEFIHGEPQGNWTFFNAFKIN
jgi:hypothetical protein